VDNWDGGSVGARQESFVEAWVAIGVGWCGV
jgi:hypothetical protein